ncbi:hypothetical protein JCM11641_003267 [Rhodosporidiobolus odoratus]
MAASSSRANPQVGRSGPILGELGDLDAIASGGRPDKAGDESFGPRLPPTRRPTQIAKARLASRGRVAPSSDNVTAKASTSSAPRSPLPAPAAKKRSHRLFPSSPPGSDSSDVAVKVSSSSAARLPHPARKKRVFRLFDSSEAESNPARADEALSSDEASSEEEDEEDDEEDDIDYGLTRIQGEHITGD